MTAKEYFKLLDLLQVLTDRVSALEEAFDRLEKDMRADKKDGADDSVLSGIISGRERE